MTTIKYLFDATQAITLTNYLTNVKVFLIGGGGGGTGTWHNGGGAGDILTATYYGNLVPGQRVSVTIGLGGTGAQGGDNTIGGDGGTTTIDIAGTKYSALGGYGGSYQGGHGSSGGGGGTQAGNGGTGGSGGSNGSPGAEGASGGIGMGTTNFNAAITFMGNRNDYGLAAGKGGGGATSGTHGAGGGAGGITATSGNSNGGTGAWGAGGGVGYGAGGGSGGLRWRANEPQYFGLGGSGAPGMVYMWADIIPPQSPTLGVFNMSKTFGDSAFTITQPSSASSGAFTYSVISGTSVISMSGTTITILTAGTATVQATQAASGNYTSATKDATITIHPQPVTLGPFDMTKTLGDSPFTITQPSSASSGTFDYSVISGTSVISMSGTTITILTGGTATVRATQYASGNYAGAYRDDTITIKQPPTLGVFDMTKTFGDSAFTITQPSSDSSGTFDYSVISGTSVISMSGTTINILTGGTATVRAYQAASGNYTSAYKDATIRIYQLAATLSASPNIFYRKFVSGASISFDVITSNAGAVARTYESSNTSILSIPTSSNHSGTIVAPGKIYINVIQPATINYTAITTNQLITIIIVGSGTTYSSETFPASFDLTGTNLSNSSFSNCNLTSANLFGATVNASTNLTTATLTNIRSGRIIGKTSLLPPNFTMI